MVDISNAKSTDMQNPEDVHELSAKCLDVAVKWAPVAEEIWDESHECQGCTVCSAGD
jgi:hypothetical protein